MIKESILENLSIHNDNLSAYYLGSVFITVISVFFTWWYPKYCTTKTESFDKLINSRDKEDEFQEGTPVVDNRSKDESFIDQKVMSHIKTSRHVLAEEVAANLTAQQLEEEKEMEKQQLQAIFHLLQEQKDKYQVSSIEELEDQLRLYR